MTPAATLTYGSMHKVVPEGTHGDATIEHFEVSQRDAEWTRLRAVVTGGHERAVPPGKYVRLTVNRQLVMSDTPMEVDTNREVVRKANGNVLIGGLGIGLILTPIARKPQVDRLVVVEKNANVIALVEPRLRETLGNDSSKLTIVHGDAHEWLPARNRRFDVVYLDIWTDISPDAVPAMERLHERFRPFLRNEKSWISSWRYQHLKAQTDREADYEDDEDDWEDE